jgi:hypothetical protein
VTRRTARRAAIAAALLAVLQAVTGLAGPVGAAATACAAPERIFAVDAGTGHLSELQACPDPASITVVGEVDAGDWRSARRILAAADGAATVLYSVTADGRLEARRQAAPGAALSAPTQVGAGIDWSRFRQVVSPGAGYLVADEYQAVRTFRHLDWATGGGTLVEGPQLLEPHGAWPTLGDLELTGLGARGYAEAFFMDQHWRVWRGSDGRPIAYPSGAIPRNVRIFVTGSEPGLYGISAGAVVRLKQAAWSGYCPFNTKPWRVANSLPGAWSGVVVPQRAQVTGDWPAVADYPTWPDPQYWTCPDGIGPYQWQ